MPIARVTEISATSSQSFEDAIKQGLDRANATLRNVKAAWIKEQQVRLDGGADHRVPGEHARHVHPRRVASPRPRASPRAAPRSDSA